MSMKKETREPSPCPRDKRTVPLSPLICTVIRGVTMTYTAILKNVAKSETLTTLFLGIMGDKGTVLLSPFNLNIILYYFP